MNLLENRRWKSVAVFGTFLATLVAPMFGQTKDTQITVDDVLSLQNAGVSSQLIVQKVQTSGIDFDVSPQVMLQLKSKAVPDAVIQALLTASQRRKDSIYTKIKELYQAGNFDEIVKLTRSEVRAKPAEGRARSVLILALLKLKQRAEAENEFARLKQNADTPAQQEYVKQIAALFDNIDKQDRLKRELSTALNDLQADKAASVIDSFLASDLQKQMLRTQLDVYAGDFERANERLTSMRSAATASEKASIDALQRQVLESRTAFESTMAKVDAVMYSDQGASYCNSFLLDRPYPKEHVEPILAPQLQQHFENVKALSQIAPLNPRVMDLVFHTTMIIGSYDQLQQIGDRILNATGSIHVPFMSYDKYFFVVIDGRSRRLRTAEDSHSFDVKFDYALHGIFGALARDQHRARWYAKLEPFDLSFEQLAGISQKANDWRGGVQDGTYALKLSPQGVAPLYVLMNVIHCRYGEAAQKMATYNLGLYVLHVAKKDALKTGLLNPSKVTPDIWASGLMTALTSNYSAMAARSGNSLAGLNAALATDAVASEQARLDQYAQSQQQGWSAKLNMSAAAFLDVETFRGVEALLELL